MQSELKWTLKDVTKKINSLMTRLNRFKYKAAIIQNSETQKLKGKRMNNLNKSVEDIHDK